MKKILLICTFIATSLTLFGCEENNSQYPVEIQSSTPAQEQESSFVESNNTTQTSNYITESDAKSIALTHAELDENSVTALRITFEFDDGVAEYEVEFYNGDTEYDYEINATTGEIISFDYEIENKFYSNNTTTPIQSSDYITEVDAKTIALTHAELNETDVTALRITFDIDDGVAEYEVEFYNGNKEYDYEINAITGDIISFDYEIENKFNLNANTSINTTTTQTSNYITEVDAKSIALTHANLNETDVTALRITFDIDDGVAEYEVEFYNGNKEYDYEINAITGDIISFDYEIENKFNLNANTSTNTTTNTTTTQTSNYITEVDAKSIALTHANLNETDVTALRITFEFDDGVAEYEVEFYNGNKEYDYEINAITGDIISFDYEIENKFNLNTNTSTNNTTTQTNGFITEEQAKSIALTHANLNETDITGLRIKLDYDDGVAEYEVEFYNGRNEFDYEINATTGNIISYDFDIQDTSQSVTGEYISQDEAKSIALQHAGVLESNISNFKIKLDYDDGRAEYEIEWKIGKTEYEYDLNASTGAILSFDVDND